ncbi:fibronectin type III domain-containing protein [Neolewinella persica]|uniref:fibronectin type III domain-containing protein n=1 Tax=Neolewinella persica TaxID=70998 RepID=UPI000362F4D7|nr:fibronectin type III domain-containing protein [Neolewinella persica]
MKSRLFYIGLCFFLLLLVAPLVAQITPVRVDVRLFQSSVYPEDLSQPGAAAVSVTLTDMDRAILPGYLRLTLSNSSGQELTTPLVAETRVDLMPFSTVTFTGPGLDRFVRLLGADAGAMNGLESLVFAEGELQLCAEFYDLDFPFEPPISNQNLNCAFGYAELHEPPTPIAPIDEEVAIDRLQDAVNFIWAPNYFAGPVINYLTVWDVPREWAGVTPDIIMTSLEPVRQPIRVNELNALSKLWTAREADLIPGHRYLYQIQATDPTGRVRFRNNGYSRPVFFDYTYPEPFVDQVCYEPDGLALEGGPGNYELNWTGLPLDSVNHTVSIVTLPERQFVLLSELLTTPTYPVRQLVDGGPEVRFNYDITVDLDTTNQQAYLVTLCTVCSLTGEGFCREVVLGTPEEAEPDDDPDPTDSTLVCGFYPTPQLSVTDLTATTATVGWELPDDFAGSLVLSWSGPENSGVPTDSTVLSATIRSQPMTGLVPNTGYIVTLCVVCPDGARSCFSEQVVTPAYECLTEDDILAGVTVSALLPDRILADWSGAFPGTDPNGWSAYINDGSEEPASETVIAPPAFTAPAAAPTDTPPTFTTPAADPTNTTFSALNPASSYVVTVCYACPGDSTVCTDWPVDLNGDYECLTGLNFTRTDSTDTTLDLAWSYDPNAVSATDSFTLVWQLADGGPERMATVAYEATSFTITDRIPGQIYTLRVCAECSIGQPSCRDLPPFGGCVAEYLPELVDLRGRHALLSWSGDDRDLETQVRYGIRNLGGWENAQPVNSQNFTAANYNRPEDQLVQTAPLYAMTYVGQVRTVCADSLWSEWSEPILFSRSCALAITDSLHVWGITDSNAIVTGQVMPQAQNYVFSYRQTGTQEWILSTDLPTPDLHLTELSADTEYEVKMRYRCGGGVWSNFSQVFTFRTLTPCASPENISFSDVTASSAVISWTTGSYSEATLFRYRKAGSGGAWQTVTFVGNSGTLTDLAPGEAYEIEAVSQCAANNSYVSAPQSLVLDCAPPELRVTDITVSSAQLQAFGLSPAAASNGFSYRVVGAADWILVDSAYLTGLDDLTEYEARARTTCTSGEDSEWSNPVRFETPVDCRVPNELGVTSLSSVSAGLRWATTGSNERWEIRLMEEGAADREQEMAQAPAIGIQDAGGGLDEEGGGSLYGGGGVYNNPTPPDPYADWRLITSESPEVLVEGLKMYTDYRIVVRTHCPTNGWTDYSEKLLFRTLCTAQPSDSLYADQILEDRARLRFYPDTRCPAAHEIVVEHPETGYSDASTQTPWYHTFTNLEPNTVYRFKVRTKANDLTFTPAAAGYTTLADVGADAGARVVGEAGWTGFSDWQTFRTDDCAAPYNFVENALDQSTIEITWAASNGINNYQFKYKLADDLGSDWAYLNVSEPYVRLENILRGTLYDYQVTELCQNGQTFQPAPQDTFLLKRVSRINGFYACGVESDVDLSNEVPLGSLAEGDTITAFDFPVVITSVSGSGGTFSGEGEIRVPYFNKAKATFSFDGIFVNDDYQMKGGKLVAIGAGVEVLPPWADELLAEVMGALQMLDAYLEEEQLELMDSLMSCCSATLPAELRQRIFDLQNCYAAQAEQGTPNYSLCADMLEALMADIQAFLDAIYGGTFQVAFNAAPYQTYGFDGYNDGDGGRRSNWYETDTLAKEPYTIAFKSIKAGGSDQVLAEIPRSDDSPNPYQDSVGYELPTGTIPDFSYPDASATTATITITDASGTDEHFFLAATQIDPTVDTVPPFIAGLLDVIAYEELTPTIRIIEVTPGALNNLDERAVEKRIQDIYAQAVVKPTVEYVLFDQAGQYIPEDYEAPLQAVPSGWLTPYTQQMKAFRRNYLDRETPEDDEYIFFVFGEDSFEDTDRLGFMPPGRRFSFIYRNDNKNTNVADFGRTIAHELGHGAYVLRHPWTENDDRYVAQGESRNLMDESGGTELWKWQWDLIHDPEAAPWLPGDEDGESVVAEASDFTTWINENDTYTFITPSGLPLTLPPSLLYADFSNGDEIEEKYLPNTCNTLAFLTVGSLLGFTLKKEDGSSQKYRAKISCENGLYFTGYHEIFPGEGEDYTWGEAYIDIYTPVASPGGIDKVILSHPIFTLNNLTQTIVGQHSIAPFSPSSFTNNYTAAGQAKGLDFLGSFIDGGGLTEERELPLNNYPPYTREAITFLDIACSGADYKVRRSPYIFVHANQISKYPGFFTACGGSILQEIRASEVANLVMLRSIATAAANRLREVPDFNGKEELIQHYESEERDCNVAIQAEYNAWSQFSNKSIYKEYYQSTTVDWSESFWAGLETSENDPEVATKAQSLLESFYRWRDYPCVFVDLTAEQRVLSLQLLSNLSFDERGMMHLAYRALFTAIMPTSYPLTTNLGNTSGRENLLNAILVSTPEQQYINVFAELKRKDYELYHVLSSKMRCDEFTQDCEKYLTLVSKIFMTVDTREVEGSIGTWNQGSLSSVHEFVNISGQDYNFEHEPVPAYMPFENFMDGTSYKSKINSDRSITVTGKYEVMRYGDIISNSYALTGQPGDYVALTLPNEVSITIEGVAGQKFFGGNSNYVLVVPFSFAYVIMKKIENAESAYKTRLAFDLITIATIPMSFGGSTAARAMLFVARADELYAVVDLYFAEDQFQFELGGETTFSRETHRLWEGGGMLLAAATVTELVKGIGGAVGQFKFSRALRTIDELRVRNPDISMGELQQFKSKLQAQYDALPTNLPSSSDVSPGEYRKYREHLKSEIDGMDFNIRLKPSNGESPLKIHLTPKDYIRTNLGGPDLVVPTSYTYRSYIFVSDNVHPVLGHVTKDGENLSLITQPSQWTSTTFSTPIGKLDDVAFVDAIGVERKGSFDLFYDAAEGEVKLRATSLVDDGFTTARIWSEQIDLYNLVQSKKWNIRHTDLNPRLMIQLNQLENAKKMEVMSFLAEFSSDVAGRDKAVKFLNDFSTRDELLALIQSNSRGVKSWDLLSNQPIGIRTSRRLNEQMLADLDEHSNLPTFLASSGRRTDQWVTINRINQASNGAQQVKLADWFEDMWIGGKVDVEDAARNGTVTVKFDGDGVADIGDAGVDIARHDDVIGDFTVARSSPDGNHGLVKSRTGGKAACRLGACFPAGTLIRETQSRTIRIEDISPIDVSAPFSPSKIKD